MNDRICVLDKQTSNRIAAGEVVERPSSAVKELVENSMDADSSSITVEIKKGGIEYIRITDNGKGIHPEDVSSAFLRHATSKIYSGHDLRSISTLGFRGEALPSIAAVSKLEMYTRTRDADFGTHISLEAGEITDHNEYGCPEGTTITVRNLFFNTPARLKFLKRDSVEAGYVADVVTRLSLANPHISFKFIKDGRTEFHTPGDGNISSVIRAVYGGEIASQILEVDYISDDIRVFGYVGKPEISKSNRTFQTVVVNGRYVHNQLISAAVSAGLQTQIMVNKYPFFVLHINLDPLTVDVNVHPNKYELRFQNNELISEVVTKAVEEGYKKYSMPDFYISSDEPEIRPVARTVSQVIEAPKATEKIQTKPIETEIKPVETETKFTPLVATEKDTVIKPLATDNKGIELKFADRPAHIEDLKPTVKPIVEVKQPNQPVTQKVEQMSMNIATEEETIIVGQIFSTYILVQKGNNAYIVDQHAAHERLLYEQFVAMAQTNMIKQDLLLPYIYDAGYLIAPQFEELIPELNELGFEVEPFGQYSYQIRTVPIILGQINLQEFFEGLTSVMKNSRKLQKTDLIKEELMMMSCKAAIKAGQALDKREMETLLSLIAHEETPLTCPHGRPIMLKMSKTDIEKRFKRIQ